MGLEVFPKGLAGADPKPSDLGTLPLADSTVASGEAVGPASPGSVP